MDDLAQRKNRQIVQKGPVLQYKRKCGKYIHMEKLLSTTLPAAATKGGDILSLIKDASPIGKGVMLLLLIFSVVSWAVIIFF